MNIHNIPLYQTSKHTKGCIFLVSNRIALKQVTISNSKHFVLSCEDTADHCMVRIVLLILFSNCNTEAFSIYECFFLKKYPQELDEDKYISSRISLQNTSLHLVFRLSLAPGYKTYITSFASNHTPGWQKSKTSGTCYKLIISPNKNSVKIHSSLHSVSS